jgi:excisionase family DNA binding protein
VRERIKKMDMLDSGKKIGEPEFYTPDELSELLRIPKRTLEKWTLQKRLTVVKVGRLNRFPRVEIQKRLLGGSLLK